MKSIKLKLIIKFSIIIILSNVLIGFAALMVASPDSELVLSQYNLGQGFKTKR
jgi:hypothetical protein